MLGWRMGTKSSWSSCSLIIGKGRRWWRSLSESGIESLVSVERGAIVGSTSRIRRYAGIAVIWRGRSTIGAMDIIRSVAVVVPARRARRTRRVWVRVGRRRTIVEP